MTDRGSIAVLADLRFVEDRLRNIAVVSDRDSRGGTHAERNDADAIVLSSIDEVADQPFGDGEAISRAEIFGGHAARRIERDDDVDAVAVIAGHPEHALRPRERDHHEQCCRALEHERQSGKSCTQRQLWGDQRQ